jgi:hypothetical protein
LSSGFYILTGRVIFPTSSTLGTFTIVVAVESCLARLGRTNLFPIVVALSELEVANLLPAIVGGNTIMIAVVHIE